MNLFQSIRKYSTDRVRKIVYFCVDLATTILGFVLLFVPFVRAGYGGELIEVTPYRGISLLNLTAAMEDGGAYLGLGLFLFWIVYMTISVISVVRGGLGLFKEEERAQKRAKRLCVFHSICTGIYYIGGFLFNFINNILGGFSQRTASAAPFICVLVIDLLFAFYLGILRAEKKGKEGKAEVKDARYPLLQKKKWETFFYASLLVACAMCAFLTKIIDVEYVGTSRNFSSYDFSMKGIDVLKNYAALERGSQILAFLLFLSITFVLTFYFLAFVALLSKAPAFFRFAMGSILASGIGCFLIGMYGKYYQMLQSLNVEAIVAWVEYKISTYGVSVNLETLKTEFLSSYEISSPAFYFFLGAIGIIGVLLARRPYSQGLMLAKELEPSTATLVAKIASADIDVERAEGDDQRNPAPLLANGNGVEGGEATPLPNVDPCPAFTELDALAKESQAEMAQNAEQFPFEEPTLPKLVQFIVQYARDSRLHLFYTAEDIATFIAGLGATKLTILQGMSGTGKTSLPKIFSEALLSNCDIVEVESSWRDKNELLGYYNEFSKAYTPKKFTQALYAASLNPDKLTFIVLDEMNLSRIEYYFSDFLSLMENEPSKREIKLLNVGLFKTQDGEKVSYDGLTRGHTLKIPPNVWFIGTANRDESTFEISDKVYDRAHTMNFNKRAQKVKCYNQPMPQRFLSAGEFNRLLEEAASTVEFNVENYPVIAEVEKLLAPYNISFGNRIALQIETFVSIYCACFTATEEVIHDAVERILLTKVVAKLELKSIEDKEELATAFEELGLPRCAEFIAKLNED